MKKETQVQMPVVGDKFSKYYFIIEEVDGVPTVSLKRSVLTVTSAIGQHTVRYSEKFEDGRESTNLRSVREGHPWEDAVIVSPRGVSVICKGNKTKAKKLIAAYYAEQRKKHEKALARIELNAFLVKGA